MRRNFLKSKIHRAKVTDANLEYEGSITIDAEILRAADILPYERVEVYNISNGQRFATYAIEGTPGKRDFCINGAAAHLTQPGDLVIIASYVDLESVEISSHKPRVILLDTKNNPKNI